MRLERVHALPFLDRDEGVGTVLRLYGERGVGVDRGAVLDASLLGADRTSSRLPAFAVITAITWII